MTLNLKYSIDSLKDDTDADLLIKLKKAWGYESRQRLKIVGKLEEKKNKKNGEKLYFLTNLRSANDFSILKYPVGMEADWRNIDIVFIPPSKVKNSLNYFKSSDFVVTKGSRKN
jgi:hypothetical protein